MRNVRVIPRSSPKDLPTGGACNQEHEWPSCPGTSAALGVANTPAQGRCAVRAVDTLCSKWAEWVLTSVTWGTWAWSALLRPDLAFAVWCGREDGGGGGGSGAWWARLGSVRTSNDVSSWAIPGWMEAGDRLL